MMMKQLVLTMILAGSAWMASAASIEGKWQTIDDKTGKPKGVVQISGGSTFNGAIVGLAQGVENVCPACGNNKPLIGMTVLRGLKQKSDAEYADGTIYDPKSGRTYKAKATVQGDTLTVRGYLGISALGRSQTWKRIK